MNIRPLYDRVIVRRIGQQRTAVSGVAMPDPAAGKPGQREVAAVGTNRLRRDGSQRALRLKVGDRLIFRRYAGQTVALDGEALPAMREQDVAEALDGQADTATQPLRAA